MKKLAFTFFISILITIISSAQTPQSNYPKNGFGTKVWSDGNVYVGNFKDSIPNGKGKLYDQNGFLYEGDFVNDHFSGFGKVKYTSGDAYEGQFENDFRNGKGNFRTNDGATYVGELKKMCRTERATALQQQAMSMWVHSLTVFEMGTAA
jgi:hypothetical protein